MSTVSSSILINGGKTRVQAFKRVKARGSYEARVCFRVWVRYGGTPIPKKLGYGYGGIFFYYIFLYIIIHIFLNICKLKNKYE